MFSPIRPAVIEAIQNMLTEIPPYGARAQRRADFQLHKAEVFDLIAAVDAYIYHQAREIAAYARYQARSIGRESGTTGSTW